VTRWDLGREIQGDTGIYRDIQGYTGIYRDIYTGRYRATQGYIGIFYATRRKRGVKYGRCKKYIRNAQHSKILYRCDAHGVGLEGGLDLRRHAPQHITNAENILKNILKMRKKCQIL
jgi:hypothetical protein